MLLSELFDLLTYGELSQVSIGGKNSGGIAAADYAKVVSHVNMGLTALYTRFPLRYDEVMIEQQDHLQTYYLQPQFAETNTESTEPFKYIKDSVYFPFLNNVIQIVNVFSEMGEERPINKSDDVLSVYVPKFNAVTIPYAMEGNTFSVLYKGNHEKIIVDGSFDPETVAVEIPEPLVEPLLIYIAGRIVGNMGSTDNLNASAQYKSRFELALLEVENLGLINNQDLNTDRLLRNGWV
ncbi:MAG: hypothetical protein ACRBB6_04290 [Neptuniibacter sp.]